MNDKTIVMSRKVEVTLKSGKTIEVLRREVELLKKAGLLAGKSKPKEEKVKAKTKEEKGTGVITKGNITK